MHVFCLSKARKTGISIPAYQICSEVVPECAWMSEYYSAFFTPSQTGGAYVVTEHLMRLQTLFAISLTSLKHLLR